MKELLSLLVAAVAGGAAQVAHADSTWTLTCATNTTSCSQTVGGVQMTATAYAADTLTSTFTNGSNAGSGSTRAVFANWGSSGLGIYSATPGYALESGSAAPDHAMDNDTSPGADFNEMVHLSFDKAVDLASVAAGWTHSDSDVMVFRWRGNTAPNLTSFSPNSVQAVGSSWSLVTATGAQFAPNGVGSGGSVAVNQAGDSFSSHWLVTTAFGGASDGVDGFKLKSFTGAVCTLTSGAGGCTYTPPSGGGATPEPSSLALAAAAAFGLVGIRRRRRALVPNA